MPVGVQINYYGTGIKGNPITRDYEISEANGDDFDLIGWFVANGVAGTPNYINKFLKCYQTAGNTGGSNDAVVISHKHDIRLKCDSVYDRAGDNLIDIRPTVQDPPTSDTETVGVSGVGLNQPSYITSIPVIRMS